MPRRSSAAALAPPLTPTEVSAAKYIRLAIEALIETPLNPRTKHVDDGSLRELAESIAQHDVIEPLVVRESPTEPGKFEIVAGSRRFRAARMAGRDTVPCMVREVTDAQLLELALQENLHRASMSALDEAHALDKLQALDPIYRDLEVLSGRIGRSETYVRDRLKLLKLDPIVVEALEADVITAKHAERIARLSPDIHRLALSRCFNILLVERVTDPKTHQQQPVRDTVDAAIEARQWTQLAPALASLRTFDQWVAEEGKVNLAAPEVQQELIESKDVATAVRAEQAEGLTEDEAIEQATTSLLQLSETANAATARALNVIPPDRYVVVKSAKARCEFTRRGAYVHPPPEPGERLRVDDVCTDRRRCRKHWPIERASTSRPKSSAAAARESAKAEAAAAAEQAWIAERPEVLQAFGRLLSRQRWAVVDVARRTISSFHLHSWRDELGLTLTPQTALALLLLDHLRFNSYSRDTFEGSVRQYGISAKALAAEVGRVVTKPGTAKKGGKRR